MYLRKDVLFPAAKLPLDNNASVLSLILLHVRKEIHVIYKTDYHLWHREEWHHNISTNAIRTPPSILAVFAGEPISAEIIL